MRMGQVNRYPIPPAILGGGEIGAIEIEPKFRGIVFRQSEIQAFAEVSKGELILKMFASD